MATIAKSDILKAFELIRINYDNAFYGKTENDMMMLAEFWYDSLKDFPKELVFAALKNAICHSDFVPKISAVLNELNRIVSAQQDGDGGIWSEFVTALRAVRNTIPSMSCAYDSLIHEDTGMTTAEEACKFVRETYSGLNSKIKEYCGNISVFIDIAKQDEEGLQFEKARFYKQLPLLEERIKIRSQTPPQLASLIKGITGKTQLIGDKNETANRN